MTTIQVIPACLRPSALLRVCGYARVSTDEEDQIESFVTQVEYYTSLINKNPEWIYSGVYADEGITGTSTYRRNEFNRMIQECRNGKIDLILTKSISRFARNTLECIQIIRELKQLGIGIYFEKERINTLDTESELALTIYCSFAQEESVSISRNIKWATQKRMQDGSWLISSVAYGYRKSEVGELIPHKIEAEIVVRIYDEYLSGIGCQLIAIGLNQDGIPSPKGRTWKERTVAYILLNEIYTGDLLCQKYYNEDMLPHRKKSNHGEIPQYMIPDDHEAIIPREKAALVKEMMSFRKKLLRIDQRPGMYQERYLFSGKITCGICGSHFKRQKIKVTDSNQYIQWSCKIHITNRSECKMTGVREELIRAAFLRLTRKLHDNAGILLIPLLSDVRKLQISKETQEKINLYNKRILELEKQIQMFRRDVSGGTMESAFFIHKTRQIKNDITYLRELRDREIEAGSYDGLITELEYLIRCVGKGVEEHRFDEGLFKKIVKEVIVLENRRVTFQLISGLNFMENL